MLIADATSHLRKRRAPEAAWQQSKMSPTWRLSKWPASLFSWIMLLLIIIFPTATTAMNQTNPRNHGHFKDKIVPSLSNFKASEWIKTVARDWQRIQE